MQVTEVQPRHTPHTTEPIITARNLQKRYGAVEAVRGLDLEVARGQIYGFLGPNGAGKTTTIRMLLGLIQPTRGEVFLFGQPLGKHRSSLLARVGSIVETPSAYAHLTGRENLEITRRLLGASPTNISRLLDLVGLSGAANRPVRGYSLGMKGRLSLAAALIGEPELLILDEPTNGLDPSGIREMRDLIHTFPAQGITVLVSSHLLSEVEQIATHVGIVAGGKMRFSGPLNALRAQSTPHVALEVNHPNEALKLVQATHPQARLHNHRLEVPANPSEAAHINRRLIEAGLEVSRLEPLTDSLEELFMRLTETPTHISEEA